MIKVFESEVLSVEDANDSVKILKFSVPPGFTFKPGQYVSLSVPFDGKKLRRPYSISSPPGKAFIELCVKIVDGTASNFIKTLKEDDKVEFFGPAGKFIINEDSSGDIAFISAGTGITPFVSMISSLLENKFGNKIILLKGFRYEKNILYEEFFEGLKGKNKNFEFHNILSRPENQDFENRGYVQDFLEKYIGLNFKGDVYICGLSPMIDAVMEKLISLGVSKDRIFFEKYD